MFNHTKGVYGYSSFCQISLLALEDGQEMALLLDAVVCMYTVLCIVSHAIIQLNT